MSLNNKDFIWLINWYYKQCNGDWEHGNGIDIKSLDNPGWFIKVSLTDTELSQKKFQIIDITRSENDWIYCSIKNEMFEGFGGPFNLPEILKIFRNWVEN